MMDPQPGSEGDSPKDEGFDPEEIEWLDPFADGLPFLAQGEKDDE